MVELSTDTFNKLPSGALPVAIFTTALAYCIAKLIIYPLYFHPLSKLPGPPVSWIPFLGNFGDVLSDGILGPYKKWTKRYGPIVVTHSLFNMPEVSVYDPTIIKQILTIQQYDFIKVPVSSRFLSTILGNGILVAEGQQHKHLRKLLNPAFSVPSVRNLTPFVYEPVMELFKQWDDILRAKANEPTAIEVSRWMSHVTLDVIGLAAFGERFNSVKYNGVACDEVNKMTQAFTTIFDPTVPTLLYLLRFLFPSVALRIPIKRNREFNQAVKSFRDESQALVNAGIALGRSKSNDVKGGSSSRSLLSLMVDLTDETTGDNMTPEEIREQCMTFLVAGHETTAVSMSWCLWLLAKNQDIQDQLREEVAPIFKDVDPTDKSTYPDYNTLDKLHFLNNVCKETIRHIPVVPLTSREPVKDVNLGGYMIPKGTSIVIPITAIHESTAIWGEDAEEFRPSRWDEEPASKASPYEYLPFLAGGRQCIGYRFALVELKIILGLVITRYHFSEKPGFKVTKKLQIAWRPDPNMTLLVKRIEPL